MGFDLNTTTSSGYGSQGSTQPDRPHHDGHHGDFLKNLGLTKADIEAAKEQGGPAAVRALIEERKSQMTGSNNNQDGMFGSNTNGLGDPTASSNANSFCASA
jgi:hypothetical protein